MKRILFQGDSITDGWRLREDEKHMGLGYPMLVSAELGFENPGEYEFINRGVSGDRTVDVYARIKKDIINLKPDIMSILIGINDVGHELGEQNGVDADKFFNIYSMLIEEVKEALPDIKIMILEPYVLKGHATAEHWESFKNETQKRQKIAKKIAEKYDLKFIPLQSKFDEAEKIASPACWTVDGAHPTYSGYELIKREWLKAFKEL